MPGRGASRARGDSGQAGTHGMWRRARVSIAWIRVAHSMGLAKCFKVAGCAVRGQRKRPMPGQLSRCRPHEMELWSNHITGCPVGSGGPPVVVASTGDGPSSAVVEIAEAPDNRPAPQPLLRPHPTSTSSPRHPEPLCPLRKARHAERSRPLNTLTLGLNWRLYSVGAGVSVNLVSVGSTAACHPLQTRAATHAAMTRSRHSKCGARRGPRPRLGCLHGAAPAGLLRDAFAGSMHTREVAAMGPGPLTPFLTGSNLSVNLSPARMSAGRGPM